MILLRVLCKFLLELFAGFGIVMTVMLVYFIASDDPVVFTKGMVFLAGFLGAAAEGVLSWGARFREKETINLCHCGQTGDYYIYEDGKYIRISINHDDNTGGNEE